jgi:two-component system response regulator VicR
MARTVLVADDEPLTAEMLALMLRFRGFEVVCAYDGDEALRCALELKPDIVLLDVIMPGREGLEVTRLLRDDPELAGRPMVLFSSEDESEIEWRQAGATLFLQKPLDVLALPELVQRLLDRRPPPETRRRLAA